MTPRSYADTLDWQEAPTRESIERQRQEQREALEHLRREVCPELLGPRRQRSDQEP